VSITGVENLSSASEEYDKANEDEFRFMLQQIVDRLDSKLSSVAAGVGEESLSSNSRLSHVRPSVGVKTYPDQSGSAPVVLEDNNYFFGNWEGFSITKSIPVLNQVPIWFEKVSFSPRQITSPVTWVQEVVSPKVIPVNQTPPAAALSFGSEFKYQGVFPESGEKYFLVNWSLGLVGYSYIKGNFVIAGLTMDTTPTYNGPIRVDTHVDLPGTYQVSQGLGSGYEYLNGYFYLGTQTCSGTAIVKIKDNVLNGTQTGIVDRLGFQWAMANNTQVDAIPNPYNVQALTPYADGFQISIVPLGNG